jgi:hypothetical protein
MSREIYRGYDIEEHSKEGYVIKLNGKVVGSQPSLEFAYKFIDAEKRKQVETTA